MGLLCKQTSKRPSNVLFYFPQEQKPRITPMQIINKKELDLTAGMVVTFNWDKEKVEVEILICFVYGTFITKTKFLLQYHLESILFVIYMSVALCWIVEMVAWQKLLLFF